MDRLCLQTLRYMELTLQRIRVGSFNPAFPGAWRESGSSGFLSSAWFDDRSMHRCDRLTERSLGA